MTQSVEISDELMRAVCAEARRRSRTVAEQFAHWVKIGRAIERSGKVDPARIDAALRGVLRTEDLTDVEGSVWGQDFADAVLHPSAGEITYFEERRAKGLGVGLDENGDLVYATKRP